MEVAEDRLDRRLLNTSELNVMIRNFWNTLPMTAESAKAVSAETSF